MSAKAETYRLKAEECLRAATGAETPAAKATWLEMAQQWMLLATSRDQRLAHEPTPHSEDETRPEPHAREAGAGA